MFKEDNFYIARQDFRLYDKRATTVGPSSYFFVKKDTILFCISSHRTYPISVYDFSYTVSFIIDFKVLKEIQVDESGFSSLVKKI